ncbi:hypothetical protein COO60DRAFT_1540646 [Scenedesmus sp. NREL 46B-D3]|nr:hypothetical protein COO60DRAFT_1540646 [Scenedesmus sp. NREL 46B-D3]
MQAMALPSTLSLEHAVGGGASETTMSDGAGMGGVGGLEMDSGPAGTNLGALAGNAISSLTNTEANAIIDRGATQGQLINQALAAKGGDTSGTMGVLVASKAALQAAIVRGGGSVAGQAAAAAGQVKDAAANVAKAATDAIGSGMGSIFNRAGRFVSRLSDLTGVGEHVASSSGFTGDVDGDYASSTSGYVTSSDGSSYTLPDGTTWSDASEMVTMIDGAPGAMTPTSYTYDTPLSASTVSMPTAGGSSSGTAGSAVGQSAGVMQGSMHQGGTLQGAQQGAQQGFMAAGAAADAAAVTAAQGGSGLVSVTGPFPDAAAAAAAAAASLGSNQ